MYYSVWVKHRTQVNCLVQRVDLEQNIALPPRRHPYYKSYTGHYTPYEAYGEDFCSVVNIWWPLIKQGLALCEAGDIFTRYV